ncbi:MAG: hypothetical protein JW705_06875 [Methanosarcinaceae archaeon]|nr:hypothetical protein [Methanosarcinaceae archaeon]
MVKKEGNIERISHWVNKLRNTGGSIYMPLPEKPEMLYENCRIKNVGTYLRNQAPVDENFAERKNARHSIERSNGHTKAW